MFEIKRATPKIKAQEINCMKIFNLEPLSIPFQGIKVYVAKVTKIKKSNKFVKLIYLWFKSITSLTSSPLYLDKGRINLLEACCSMMCADQPVIRDITKIGV